MVQPTTFFGLKPMRSTIKNVHAFNEAASDTNAVSAVTGCSGGNITPECLSNLYGFSGATAYTDGLLGIAGFLEQYPSASDLSTFLSSYATEGNTGESYTCTVVNGGSCPASPSSPGTEANLDVQYARAITEKIPNVFYSVGGSPPIVGSGKLLEAPKPFLYFLFETMSGKGPLISISPG
jgi:tripeptidyl-peptidase-1